MIRKRDERVDWGKVIFHQCLNYLKEAILVSARYLAPFEESDFGSWEVVTFVEV